MSRCHYHMAGITLQVLDGLSRKGVQIVSVGDPRHNDAGHFEYGWVCVSAPDGLNMLQVLVGMRHGR